MLPKKYSVHNAQSEEDTPNWKRELLQRKKNFSKTIVSAGGSVKLTVSCPANIVKTVSTSLTPINSQYQSSNKRQSPPLNKSRNTGETDYLISNTSNKKNMYLNNTRGQYLMKKTNNETHKVQKINIKLKINDIDYNSDSSEGLDEELGSVSAIKDRYLSRCSSPPPVTNLERKAISLEDITEFDSSLLKPKYNINKGHGSVKVTQYQAKYLELVNASNNNAKRDSISETSDNELQEVKGEKTQNIVKERAKMFEEKQVQQVSLRTPSVNMRKRPVSYHESKPGNLANKTESKEESNILKEHESKLDNLANATEPKEESNIIKEHESKLDNLANTTEPKEESNILKEHRSKLDNLANTTEPKEESNIMEEHESKPDNLANTTEPKEESNIINEHGSKLDNLVNTTEPKEESNIEEHGSKLDNLANSTEPKEESKIINEHESKLDNLAKEESSIIKDAEANTKEVLEENEGKEVAAPGTFSAKIHDETSSNTSEGEVTESPPPPRPTASETLRSWRPTGVTPNLRQLYRSRSLSSPSLLRQITQRQHQERNVSYESGRKRVLELTNALTFMVCKDNLPYSIVEKEGFRRFTKVAVPLYKVPSRKIVIQMVSNRYSVAVENARLRLLDVSHFSVSADIYTVTSTTKEFLVVSAHFIGPHSRKLETLMLGVRRLRENHTADYLAENMKELLQHFNIPLPKVVGVCTDGRNNMVAGVRKLIGEGKHVCCFAHLLNLIVTDGLEDETNSVLKNLILEVKSIVSFARNSNVFMEKLRREQEQEGTAEGSVTLLVLSVPTKWNSTYHMLKRFLELSPSLATILADPSLKKAPRMVTGADLELIIEVISILMPFEEAAREISGSRYVTASVVIPLVSIIKGALNAMSIKHHAAKKLLVKLKASLKEQGQKVLDNPLLSHATLSDPRFKNLYMNPVAASEAASKFGEEVKNYLAETGKLSPFPPTEVSESSSSTLWSSHDQYLAKNEPGPSEIQGTLPNELKLYLEQALLPRLSDPFTYWEQNKTAMPGLAYISLKYLTMVGCLEASESLVTTINDIVSDGGNRLTDQHINERVFLNRLDQKYWPM